MKPRYLAFPLNLVLTATTALAVFSPLNSFAVDFTWGGTTDSDWTNNGNWTTLTAPTYGTNYAGDTLRISNGAGAGAVYDPGSALTTTFGGGRAFILGSATAGSLTVTSGTLAAVRATVGGNEPIMANNANASLLINGGAVDLTAHLNTFLFLNSGTGNTSDLTISSGSFSSNGFNMQQSGTGAGTINLDGGFMAVNAFTRPATTGSTIFNLNGGTLRARTNSTSFLPAHTGLQTIVEAGGAVIDTNGFNITIAEVLEHDTTLEDTPDGGLTKNNAGTLTLSGTNTFTGPVTVNAGTALATPSRILLSNDSAAGTGAITLAGDFAEIQVNTGRTIANAVNISDTTAEKTILLPAPGSGSAFATFSGPITINEINTDHFRVRSDSSCFLTFSGPISGSGGIFKFQAGRLNLNNGSNSFQGDVKITHGEVSFVNGGLGSTGRIRMEGATGVNGASLRWDPTNDQDVSSRIDMFDGKFAQFVLAEQTTPSFDQANVTFATSIGNNSTASMIKTGPGTLALTQPSTYSGGTTVTQGVLDFVNDGLGTSGSVTMNGAILRWATGNTQDLSSRIVMVDAKTASFSTNGNDVTFATAIGNSSTGNLTKTNTTGTLTLNGTNTYTGTTTVGGGTLKLAAGATITASASVTIGAAGTLDTSDQTTYIVPAGQPIAFGINAGGSGSAGKIAAAGLDVGNATVTYNITGTPDDPVYVLATYTGTLLTTFLSVPAPPTGYTLNYAYEGNKIALVQDAVSGFAAWKAANGNPSGGLGDDHDGDGVDNGMEYFLFGNTNSTGFTALPGVINTAGVLSVTWTKAATGYDGTYGSGFVVETSDTLAAGSWVTAPLGTNPGEVEITGSNVKYTFPSGTKEFARLKVTGP